MFDERLDEMQEIKEGIKILIVDDHSMVRQGLRDFIDSFPDFILVGEATNGIEAISFTEKNETDVILMDLIMPEMNGIEATKKIIKNHPNIKIIALTTFQDSELITAAFEAGVYSFLQKNITIKELGNAIRNASEGIPTLSPEATRILINSTKQKPIIGSTLTKRERQILSLMVDSRSNPEIAEELNISLSTVKTHVTSILSKLDVSKRIDAVKLAITNKLVN